MQLAWRRVQAARALTLARGVPRLHRGLQAALAQAEQPARAAPGRRRRVALGVPPPQHDLLRSMFLGIWSCQYESPQAVRQHRVADLCQGGKAAPCCPGNAPAC